MRLPIKIAADLYFGLQHFRREPVRQVLAELQHSQWFDARTLKDMQWKRLKQLLQHAYNHVPYYRGVLDRAGLTPQGITSYDDFERVPLLKKNLVQRNPTVFYSNHTLKIHHTLASTSGSCGTPLKLYRDNTSWAHLHANLLRGLSWHGIAPGTPYAMVGGIGSGLKTRLIGATKDLVFNRIHQYAVDMNKNKCRSFLLKVKRFRPSYFYGYPSAIYDLACSMEELGITFPAGTPKITLMHGETLDEVQKAKVETVLNTRVVNSYGCAEVGLIGFECDAGGFHTPMESVYLEVVDGGVVVTDLHNYSFPMIRYDLGDVLTLTDDHCPCGRSLPLFNNLKGKLRQVIEFANGHRVHTVFFNSLFKDLVHRGAPIERYQVIRTADSEFDIKLKVWARLSSSHDAFLKRELTRKLGPHCMFTIQMVDDIPPTEGGKYRAYVEQMAGKRN